MKPWRVVGVALVALGLSVGISSAALAGADSGGPVPMVGKDGGPAPAAIVPAGAGPGAPAAVTNVGKDSPGMAPASVAGAPGRAGGIDPTLLGTLLSSTGLLTLGGGLVLQRRRS